MEGEPVAVDAAVGAPAKAPDRLAVASAATSRAARNVVIGVAAELAGKVATLVFTVAVARALGNAEFGAFSYALSFGLLLATLPSWGFDDMLVQRGSADPASLGRLFAECLALRSLVALPVVVIGALAGSLGRPTAGAKLALVLILVAAVLDTFADAGRSAAGALEKRGRTAIAHVVQRFSLAALGILVLALGFGLVAVSLVYLVSSLVGVIGVVVACRGVGVWPDLSAVTRKGMAQFWHVSFAMGVDNVVAMALFRIDAVFLGALKGDAAVGRYAAVYRLLETVLFVTWALSRAIFPIMSRTTDPLQVRRGVERGISAAAFVFVPYGVVLLLDGSRVVRLVFGTEYVAGSAPIAAWLAAAPVAFAVSFLVSYGLLARGRSRLVLVATVVGAVANIAGNLIAIPSMGATGAAMVTTLSYTGECVALVLLGRRVFGWVRLPSALAVVVGAGAAMAGTMLLLPLPVVPDALAGGVVFLAAWYVLARQFEPDQIAVVRSLARRP